MLLLHVRDFGFILLYKLSNGVAHNTHRNSFCDSIQTDRLDIMALQYPGEANLVETPYGDYNDKVRSYQCLRI